MMIGARTAGPGLVAGMRSRTAAMLEHLEALVVAESPSPEPAAVAGCADVAGDLAATLLGVRAERLQVDGTPHLRWCLGPHPRVLLLGHLDTVWPLGTLDRWSFEVADGRATGPGVFDMKAGVVALLHAVASLDDPDGICILLTGDEEVGSPTSRTLIEETARGLSAVLVAEPAAPGGAVKTGRKGVSLYRLEVEGRAAHAGLDPERGTNALLELSHQALHVAGLSRVSAGTTVTPTVASAGTATNVVPARAWMDVDVRATTTAEQLRVDEHLRSLAPHLPDARLHLHGGVNRPPLDEDASRDLFARAEEVADRLGLPSLRAVTVGGASDGNFTAGVGTPTLDGLGPAGDGAHAEGEHVLVHSMPERAALLAALLADLLAEPA